MQYFSVSIYSVDACRPICHPPARWPLPIFHLCQSPSHPLDFICAKADLGAKIPFVTQHAWRRPLCEEEERASAMPSLNSHTFPRSPRRSRQIGPVTPRAIASAYDHVGDGYGVLRRWGGPRRSIAAAETKSLRPCRRHCLGGGPQARSTSCARSAGVPTLARSRCRLRPRHIGSGEPPPTPIATVSTVEAVGIDISKWPAGDRPEARPRSLKRAVVNR